jgi:transposase
MGNTKNTRREFSAEYKADAVSLWRESGENKEVIARRLGISGTTLANWVRQSDIDAGKREGLSTGDATELKRLRKENKILAMERDLLKKATVCVS